MKPSCVNATGLKEKKGYWGNHGGPGGRRPGEGPPGEGPPSALAGLGEWLGRKKQSKCPDGKECGSPTEGRRVEMIGF